MLTDLFIPDHKLGEQHYKILECLQSGRVLTPIDALAVAGSMKLSSRIGELIKKGYNIKKDWLKLPNGKKVKKYWIETGEKKETPNHEFMEEK